MSAAPENKPETTGAGDVSCANKPERRPRDRIRYFPIGSEGVRPDGTGEFPILRELHLYDPWDIREGNVVLTVVFC